jgi:hypothetical protein
MNRPLKVLIVSNWDTSENTKNQYAKYDPYIGTNRYFEFVSLEEIQRTGETPDYYLICNFPVPFSIPFAPNKSIVMQLEPKFWTSTHWGPWSKPDPSLFLDVRSSDTYMNGLLWQLNKTHKELLNESPVRKTKVLSTIMSGKYFDIGHLFRIDFIKYLEANGVDIDIWSNDSNFFRGYRGYKGSHPKDDKNIGIVPYKYYFHAENNFEYNFITEKIWDSITAECVCFYAGCPNISDYVDPACYILLDPRKEKFRENLDIVKRAIENDEWSKRIDIIRKEKIRILNNHNVYRNIEQTIKKDREPPVYIIIHCCTMGKGEEILKSQLHRIKNLPLYSRVKKIFVFCVGPKILNLESEINRKICVEHLSLNSLLSEQATIRKIGTLNLEDDARILYIHTKGVSYSITEEDVQDMKKVPSFDQGDPHFTQILRNLSDPSMKKRYKTSVAWRKYMEKMVIDHYEECLEKLNDYDTVGTELHEATSSVPRHYSGNFWWMNMRCYKTHIDSLGTDYNAVENWTIRDPHIKAYGIWDSKKDLYQQIIKESEYENVTFTKEISAPSFIRPKFLMADGGNITDDLLTNFTSPIQVSFARNGLIAIPLPTGNGECRLYRGTESLTVVRGECSTEHKSPYLFDKETGEEVCIPRLRKKVWNEYLTKISKEYAEYKLLILQKCLVIEGGDIRDEFPEQVMVTAFLDPKAKVLELGGNIGRNSCVIASILENENNLVTLESSRLIANTLKRNRDINKMNFNIEVCAMSKKRLIQHDWITRPLGAGENIPEGYFEVKTITFDELQRKYNIIFDTFVVDAEGALVEIFKDMPECLDNVKMIILENDAVDQEGKNFTNNFLFGKGYRRVYTRKHPFVDEDNFFEVFIRF